MHDNLQNYAIVELRKTLKEKNISQSKLADDLLLSRQMVSNYLTGKTDLTLIMFEQICAAINIPPYEILGKYPPDAENFFKADAIVSEPESVYSHQSGILKSEVKKLQKRIVELEKIQNILQKTVEILERQYQNKCDEVDKLEKLLSDANQ